MESATAAQTTADPTVEAPSGSTASRVAELRKSAKKDPAGVQRQTWEWFKQLGKFAGENRAASDAKLNEIFREGKAVKGLDGPTDGILVTPLIQPLADRALRLLSGAWMPWQGKRFDKKNNRGDNRLIGSARLPAKAIWPRYETEAGPDGRLAFKFNTFIEPGKEDPDVKVLVIDYASVEENPGFLIKKIRDELVEITPGTYLGKILYRMGEDRYTNLGYFALKQEQ